MSEQTCTAADGKTVVYSIPGYPLMVRAVDFNALFGSTHHAAPGALQQEASGDEPLSEFKEGQWWIAELDAMVRDAGTDEQKRAVAVVHHLLRASRAAATAPAGGVTPIDMVLHCPACGMQHVDGPSVYDHEGTTVRYWENPVHRSHLCRPEDGGCGHIWRPADVPTNGVQAVKTTGKADSPTAARAAEPDTQRLNWLEQHDGEFYNIDKIVAIVGTGFRSSIRNKPTTLRAAIDAAMLVASRTPPTGTSKEGGEKP